MALKEASQCTETLALGRKPGCGSLWAQGRLTLPWPRACLTVDVTESLVLPGHLPRPREDSGQTAQAAESRAEAVRGLCACWGSGSLPC